MQDVKNDEDMGMVAGVEEMQVKTQFSGAEVVTVQAEDAVSFDRETTRLFQEGFEPGNPAMTFASFDESKKAWRTLYTQTLVRFPPEVRLARGGVKVAEALEEPLLVAPDEPVSVPVKSVPKTVAAGASDQAYA